MRIEQLTFTRFLAAIAIVIFHFGEKISPFSSNYISFLLKQANVGVSYFFILSGFVMIIAYGNKDIIKPLEYFKNRFARIYPVYLLAILLFLAYLLYNSFTIDYSGLTLNVFTIQSWVPGKALSFNRPGWSLSVEMFFYLSFPFLFNHIYKKYDYKKLIIPILLFWALSQMLVHAGLYSSFYKGFPSQSHDMLFYFPLMHFNEFLLGNLAGLAFLHRRQKKHANTDWHLLLVFGILCVWLKFNHYFVLHNGLLMLVFIPIIISTAVNNGFIAKLFNQKICVFLGEISYGIYILQIPVYKWCTDILSKIKITNETSVFYISLISLLITASLSYLYVETPLRNMIKRWKIARQPLI